MDWRQILVGESPAMQRVARLVELVAHRRSNVLITGETGTGKEVAARAIHLAGPRRERPFVAINCTALPENLLEAELFGHVRGAFTGALGERAGRFERAHGGTIFLDEVGDMPVNLQAKLLRVLQEKTFERLGSSETVQVDIRVIAATNADLPRRVAAKEFREDLYYRLNVVPLEMPPLRERPTDIPLLAEHFLEKICAQERLEKRTIAAPAMTHLAAFDWPGNVRQLENSVEMAVALSGERTELCAGDFPLAGAGARPPALEIAIPEHGIDFEGTVSSIELGLLEKALARTSGNKSQAAELLGLNRTTLTAKLKAHAKANG
ncbi:MAG: sigma-54 dependent transcriptional regulator [Bryobacteraceae bacterium]|nr:sigma-54 dependent transcriptional regulator [Bryobacteraceae bacterium]